MSDCLFLGSEPAYLTDYFFFFFFGPLPQVTSWQKRGAELLWLNRFIWLYSRGLLFTKWVLSSTYGKQILQLSSMIIYC